MHKGEHRFSSHIVNRWPVGYQKESNIHPVSNKVHDLSFITALRTCFSSSSKYPHQSSSSSFLPSHSSVRKGDLYQAIIGKQPTKYLSYATPSILQGVLPLPPTRHSEPSGCILSPSSTPSSSSSSHKPSPGHWHKRHRSIIAPLP